MRARSRLTGSVGTNYAYLLIGNAARFALTLAFSAVVARYLGVERFGAFSYALAFAELFYSFADLGISGILTREIAQSRGQSAASDTSVALVLQTGLGLFALAAIVTTAWLTQPSRDAALLSTIMGFAVVFGVLLNLSQSVFRAYERMEFVAFILVAERLLAVVFVLGVILNRGSLLELALAYAFASMITAAAALLVVSVRFVRVSWRCWAWGRAQRMLTMAVPLAGAMIFIAFKDRVNFILLMYWSGEHAVGIYSAGYRLVAPLLTPASLVGMLLVPVFSRQIAVSPADWRHSLAIWIGFALGVGNLLQISVYGLAPWLTSWVFGQQYQASVPVAQWLALGIVFPYGHFVLAAALLASGRLKGLFLSAATSGVVTLAAGSVLIPRHAEMGAAIANVCGEAAYFLVSARQVQELVVRELSTEVWLRILAAFLLPYSAFWLIGSVGPLIATLCCITGFLFLVRLTGLWGPADVRLLWTQLRQRSELVATG